MSPLTGLGFFICISVTDIKPLTGLDVAPLTGLDQNLNMFRATDITPLTGLDITPLTGLDIVHLVGLGWLRRVAPMICFRGRRRLTFKYSDNVASVDAFFTKIITKMIVGNFFCRHVVPTELGFHVGHLLQTWRPWRG